MWTPVIRFNLFELYEWLSSGVWVRNWKQAEYSCFYSTQCHLLLKTKLRIDSRENRDAFGKSQKRFHIADQSVVTFQNNQTILNDFFLPGGTIQWAKHFHLNITQTLFSLDFSLSNALATIHNTLAIVSWLLIRVKLSALLLCFSHPFSHCLMRLMLLTGLVSHCSLNASDSIGMLIDPTYVNSVLGSLDSP